MIRKSGGCPGKWAYVFTSVFAAFLLVMLFELFSVMLDVKACRIIVALFMSVLVSFPVAGAVQDIVLYYRDEDG